MHKIAGILDSVQPRLAPDVWGPDQRLLPSVRQKILSDVNNKIDPKYVKHIFIIGSITGHKYSDTSDIDLNVATKGFEPEKRKAHFFADINGRVLKGTNREINYFLQDYFEGYKKGFQDSVFGVYDVLQNEWVNPPKDVSKYREPENEFWSELVYAEHIVREFDRIMDRRETIKEHMQEGKASINALNKVEDELVEFANEIERGRKFTYRYGWGVPRATFQNIIFKLLEYSKHGKKFKDYYEQDSDRETFIGYLKNLDKQEKIANAIIKLQPTAKFFKDKVKKINQPVTKIENVTNKIKTLDPEKMTKQKFQQDMLLETTKIQQQGLKDLNKNLNKL